MVGRTNERFGYIPDLPDFRDFKFSVEEAIALPTSVDLRPKCPSIMDQLRLGSCTANGIDFMLRYMEIVEGRKATNRSRLFIYYNERAMEGTINSDSGAMIRDGIKSVAQQGACSEYEWPYNISKFAEKPSANAYRLATRFKALRYERLAQTEQSLKQALAQGYVFVFGFSVYQSFESQEVASTGVVPMPMKDESLLGGHCMVCVGYKDGRFICANSWGTSFGDHGYVYMPEAYLLNASLASDFWTVTQVGKPVA